MLSLVRSSNNADSILSKKTSEGFVTARFLYQYEKQNTPKKKARNKMRQSRGFFFPLTGHVIVVHHVVLPGLEFLLVLSRTVEVFDRAIVVVST